MAEVKESSLSDPARVLDEEDEATLAAIDRGARSAAEGRTAPMEEARRRLKEWLTRFSTPKKP
jgi:predicted transcriptional regulator